VVYIGIISITLFLLFPFFWMLSTSIKPPEEIFSAIPRWIPDNPTLNNYYGIWLGTPFSRYFINSFTVAIFNTLSALLVSVFAAYSISRFSFIGRKEFIVGILISQMFPLVLLLIPLFMVMLSLGLVDTRLGLIITYLTRTLPFSILMLKGYFDGIPFDIEEAAIVDGCSRTKVLYKIILPIAAPGIAAVALFAFILAWQEFLFALTLTRSASSHTLTVGLSLMLGERRILWGRLMAGSVIITIPVTVFFVYLQKYLVQGLTMGAIKG